MTRPTREIAAQLKAECRRTTDLQQRADRAEKAERSLSIELKRARERISALEEQIAELTAHRDRVAAAFGAGPWRLSPGCRRDRAEIGAPVEVTGMGQQTLKVG